MNKDFLDIQKKFFSIKRKGFIKSIYNDCGAAGKMFETLINKKLDNKQMPDFGTIEIKTILKSNKFPITLFSCAPSKNDCTQSETVNYLIDNFGYNTNSSCKCLMINVRDGKIKYCKNKFGFMIKVSYKWKRIFLCIFYNNKIYDTSIYWSFEKIEDIFFKKLNRLVCTKYIKNITHSDNLFYYYDINCYSLKSFDEVLEAIKNNIITINLNISINNGILRYHGINFVIYEKDLPIIYNKLQ